MRTRLAPAVVALALAIGLPASGLAAPAQQDRDATTTIKLKVVGCQGCRIVAVQNVGGALTYQSTTERVKHHRVEFVVPTDRTPQMALAVFASFDDIAQAGFPMIVMVGWKGKDPGESVSAAYAAGVHKGSGCWAGTTDAVVKNRLVVHRVHVRAPALGPGAFPSAAGHLTTALPALPFFAKRRASEMHVEDPSICR
jgi:hypothetical protein